MNNIIRQFLRVVPAPKNRFEVVAEPRHAARGSRMYDTEAEAQAYIDGYEARDTEDTPEEDETIYITGLFDEVEFMGPMPEEHGICGYGPFDNIEVAKYHARTLSSDPDEGVVVPIKRPE